MARQDFIFFHMALHVLWVLPIVVYFWKKFGVRSGVVALIVVVFMDADHFVYLINYPFEEAIDRLISLNPIEHKEPFLIFHSIELALLVTYVGYKRCDYSWIFLPVGSAMLCHILVDITSYIAIGLHPSYYFTSSWLMGIY